MLNKKELIKTAALGLGITLGCILGLCLLLWTIEPLMVALVFLLIGGSIAAFITTVAHVLDELEK